VGLFTPVEKEGHQSTRNCGGRKGVVLRGVGFPGKKAGHQEWNCYGVCGEGGKGKRPVWPAWTGRSPTEGQEVEPEVMGGRTSGRKKTKGGAKKDKIRGRPTWSRNAGKSIHERGGETTLAGSGGEGGKKKVKSRRKKLREQKRRLGGGGWEQKKENPSGERKTGGKTSSTNLLRGSRRQGQKNWGGGGWGLSKHRRPTWFKGKNWRTGRDRLHDRGSRGGGMDKIKKKKKWKNEGGGQ